ncbi:RebB family R body protein [Kordiimonas aestuarii]|uniref:RebB family R body protein n=1 Tax=Kordiimonas aestuarii TaxID=1005925 RepID=UPI0021D20EE4|nr:RebB family R body protein [Kordiimonas aestuarii]
MASKPKSTAKKAAPKKAPAKKAKTGTTTASPAAASPAAASKASPQKDAARQTSAPAAPPPAPEPDPRVDQAARRADVAAMEAEEAASRAADLLKEAEEEALEAADNPSQATSGGDGGDTPLLREENAVDVALGALCQSYSHALSLAFHDAVTERQRRSALVQAALAHAVEEISVTKPDDFEGRMTQLKAGLDVLDAPNGKDMAAYAGITREFKDAAEQLMKLRDQLKG